MDVEQQVKQVIDSVIKQLRKINVRITDKPKINVQNIVASGSIDMQLNLNVLALELENTEYEPEQFPGLVLRVKKPKSAVLVFSSGNLVCTGTKSVAQVKEVIEAVQSSIEESQEVWQDSKLLKTKIVDLKILRVF